MVKINLFSIKFKFSLIMAKIKLFSIKFKFKLLQSYRVFFSLIHLRKVVEISAAKHSQEVMSIHR